MLLSMSIYRSPYLQKSKHACRKDEFSLHCTSNPSKWLSIFNIEQCKSRYSNGLCQILMQFSTKHALATSILLNLPFIFICSHSLKILSSSHSMHFTSFALASAFSRLLFFALTMTAAEIASKTTDVNAHATIILIITPSSYISFLEL